MRTHSSRFFVESDITSSLGISNETFTRFQAILTTLFLVDAVPAWRKGDYDAIVKRDKLFAADTGMMASALKWKEGEALFDADRSGKMAETWVHHELSACPLAHWRLST